MVFGGVSTASLVAAATLSGTASDGAFPTVPFAHSHQSASTSEAEIPTNNNNNVDLSSILEIRRGGSLKDDKEKSSHDKAQQPPKPSTSKSFSPKSKSKSGSSKKTDTNKKTSTTSQKRSSSSAQNKAKESTKQDASGGEGNNPQKPAASSATPTPPIVEEILRQDDYYQVLGLDKQGISQLPQETAADRIKKAYRRRALQTHPDKTDGDRRAFDKVAEAYDVLSDDTKRRLYDRFGKRGVQQHAEGGAPGGGFAGGTAGFANAEDLFRSFFGAGMSSSFSSQNGAGNPFMPRRNRTLRYQLEVSLEDLYAGAVRNILVAPPGRSPYQQQHNNHNNSKRVEVHIPRGAINGQTILVSGEMDFDPNEAPGDLVFELVQRQHALFTRKNADLAVSIQIRLSEAITGVQRRIRHLNGQELVLESARRRRTSPRRKNNDNDSSSDSDTTDNNTSLTEEAVLIQDGDVHVLKGYGMPKDSQGHEFGDLYVQYHVVVPEAKMVANTLTAEEKLELGRLLDKLEGVTSSSSATTASSSSHNKGSKKNRNKSKDVLQLKKASAGDFGKSRNADEHQRHHDEHHDEQQNPFAGARQQFFFSSSSSSNPFFGMRQEGMFHEEDVDETSECRQM